MTVLDSDDLGLVALKASWSTFAVALGECLSLEASCTKGC